MKHFYASKINVPWANPFVNQRLIDFEIQDMYAQFYRKFI